MTTATGNAPCVMANARYAAATVKAAAASDATEVPAADTTAKMNALTATARERCNATIARAPRSSPAPVAEQKDLSHACRAVAEGIPNGNVPNATDRALWMTTNSYRMF